MDEKKIIDISLPIYSGMIVYPGDMEVSIETHEGDPFTGSTLVMGSHCGTHIDAPRHVFKTGKCVDELDLSVLIGKCRVFDLSLLKEAVSIEDLESYNIKQGDRILLKTANSEKGFDKFYDDYIYLESDAADYLAEKKVSLVGIDYLSVEQQGSDDHRSHNSLLKKDIIILEGINLKDVVEGEYDLVCLPLRIKGLDGSPCRAVLMQ